MSALGSAIIGPGIPDMSPRECAASPASSRLGSSGLSTCDSGKPSSNGSGSPGRITKTGSSSSAGQPHAAQATPARPGLAFFSSSSCSGKYKIRQTAASCPRPQRTQSQRYAIVRETVIVDPSSIA